MPSKLGDIRYRYCKARGNNAILFYQTPRKQNFLLHTRNNFLPIGVSVFIACKIALPDPLEESAPLQPKTSQILMCKIYCSSFGNAPNIDALHICILSLSLFNSEKSFQLFLLIIKQYPPKSNCLSAGIAFYSASGKLLIQNFHQSAAAEGNGIASLHMLGFVAGHAVHVRIIGRADGGNIVFLRQT